MQPARKPPRVLSIAGSDSGGGAGIQADLKAFARCGVHGMTAITAITAQNTVAVTAVYPLPPEAVVEQVRAVADDIGVDAVKIGMLGNAETIFAVGPTAVVVTGGHREGERATDLYYDGEELVEIPGERHPGGAAHGSGCTHSSALAAQLALGLDPLEAAKRAKEIASDAVRDGLRGLGAGPGPVDVLGLVRAPNLAR